LIALKLAETEPWLSGEIEFDQTYFGSSRKGKRERGAAGKVPVFGSLKRGCKMHVVIIPNAQHNILNPIIRRIIELQRIVYTDAFLSYDALDVSEF
jgi:transposase